MTETINSSSDLPDDGNPVYVDSVKIENIKSDINLKGMLMTQTWTELASLMSRYQAELVSWESRLLISNAKTDTASSSSHVTDDVAELQNKVRRYQARIEQTEQKLQLAQHNLLKQTEQVMKLQTQVSELSERNLKLSAENTRLTIQVEIYKKKKHKKKDKQRKEESDSPVLENGDVEAPPLTIDDSSVLSIKLEDMDELDDYSQQTMAHLAPHESAAMDAAQSGQDGEVSYYINHTIDYEDNESHDPYDVTQPLYELEPIKIKDPVTLQKKKRTTKKKGGPECPVCGKCCGNEPQLQQHMLLHSTDRPFMCRVCGWRFQRRENLIAHSRVHSGERPYKCEHCCRAFTQISARRRHMKTAHGMDAVQKELKTNAFSDSIAEILSNIEVIQADFDSSQSQQEVASSSNTPPLVIAEEVKSETN